MCVSRVSVTVSRTKNNRPYYPTTRFQSPSSHMVSAQPFPDRPRPCHANLHKCGLTQSPSCDCGQRQTINHIVDTCPLTTFESGLKLLREADDDTVIWLESTATTALAKWNEWMNRKLIGVTVKQCCVCVRYRVILSVSVSFSGSKLRFCCVGEWFGLAGMSSKGFCTLQLGGLKSAFSMMCPRASTSRLSGL